MTEKWITIKDKEPPFDMPVMCKLQHWNTKGTQLHEMIRVDAEDHSWVTADDKSELSFDWDVIEWKVPNL
ncbi:conserved hypothetical protein [Vibrio chagasii]|nr:conserved hypothetical protein [Vibrio chagasii]CAH6945728.1 conserved hypothetical protein [Vibrio chagasii]